MFSSFEVHSVSTELSGEILYSAERSPLDESALGAAATTVVCGADAAGLGTSGLGGRLMPSCCSVTVTVVLTVGTPPPAEEVIALEAAPTRLATPPPIAAA